MRHAIGEGVLACPAVERRADRYGAVLLFTDPDHTEPVETHTLKAPGPVGRLVAVVPDTRTSPHIGDTNRGTTTATPARGEKIELGHGSCCPAAQIPGCRQRPEPEDGRHRLNGPGRALPLPLPDRAPGTAHRLTTRPGRAGAVVRRPPTVPSRRQGDVPFV